MRKFQNTSLSLTKLYDQNTRMTTKSTRDNKKMFFPIQKSGTVEKHYVIKSYPLHIDKTQLEVNLYRTIENRKSVDEMEIRTIIEYETLCNLLYFSYGHVSNQHRAVPSAGGKYSINIYIAVFNVKGLKKGIYYYNSTQNCLQLIRKGDFRKEIESLYITESSVYSSSFIMFHVVDLERTCNKYGDRGYKLIHMDMGHISQNLYLVSSAHEIGIRAIFGIYENEVNRFLEVDGENEFVLLTHVFGGIKRSTSEYFDCNINDIFYKSERALDE